MRFIIRSLANSVPAAAVIQGGKVFSTWTRCKAQVDGKRPSFLISVISQTKKKIKFFLKNYRGYGMA